jgi:L-fucose isomerase-like protein
MKEKARVCAVLQEIGKGEQALLKKLEETCGVEIDARTINYAGKDMYDYVIQREPDVYFDDKESNAVLRYVEENSNNLDGLIIFNGDFSFDSRLLMTGLPTLLVDVLPGLQLKFKDAVTLSRIYGANFITATYNRLNTDVSKSVAEARWVDLTGKIKLFNAIKKIKQTRIMDIQVKGFGAEPHEHRWRVNQEEYLKKLKESLGIDVEIVDYRDVFRLYQKINADEAKNIAHKWMTEQEETTAGKNLRNSGNVTEEEVIKAGRLYLAIDKMMKESGCNAVTPDASTWSAPVGTQFAKTIGEDYLVSSALPLTEFRLHGIPVCCQSDMEGLVTQVIGEHLSERPGFHGDFVVDPFNGIAQIGHCNAPINPYGDERRVPYTIGGEPTRRPNTYVDLPEEGQATVIKINVLKNKISLWSGEIIPGNSIYSNFTEYYCCSKLVVRTNADNIIKNYEYRDFGNHNCLFYGDFRNNVKELASLLGFNIVEMDR